MKGPARTEALELRGLMSQLARLLSERSSTPRGEALGISYRLLWDRFGDQDLCDRVLLLFLSSRHDILEAA